MTGKLDANAKKIINILERDKGLMNLFSTDIGKQWLGDAKRRKATIDFLETQPAFSTQYYSTGDATGKAFGRRLLGRAGFIRTTSAFTGRESDLRAIEHLLASSDKPILLVSGLAGVGKTTVVKKFVSEHLDDNTFDHICWIDYQGSLRESFLTQIDHGYDFREYTIDEIYQKLIADLVNLKGNNLLVIDGFNNVEDEANIKSLPVNFKTIITSRYILRQDMIKRYELSTLSPEEAKEFFL